MPDTTTGTRRTKEMDDWLIALDAGFKTLLQQDAQSMADPAPIAGPKGSSGTADPSFLQPQVPDVLKPLPNMMQVPTPASPPAATPEPAPVIVIKKPIVLKMPSKKEMEAENRIMDANAMAVSSQALIYVTDAYDEMQRTISDWSTAKADKIAKTHESASPRGLIAALAGGVLSVAGAAFPEIAVGMAVLAGVAGAIGAAPDDPSDEKANATGAMHQFAHKVSLETNKAKHAAQKRIEAALKDFDLGNAAFNADSEVLERLSKGGSSNLEWIITNKLDFKLGKDVDPGIFKAIEHKLEAAFTRWSKATKKTAAWLKKQGPLGAVTNKDGSLMMGDEYYEWSLEYETDHEDEED